MPRRRANNTHEDDEPSHDDQVGDQYDGYESNGGRHVSMKRKRRDGEGEEEEEEEEDDEYDNDEEEDYCRRKRRSSVRDFLDDIAAEADSGEDEDDEDDAEDGFIDDDVTELLKENKGRMPRRPFLPTEDDQDDVEEMARRIEEKYGSLSRPEQYDEGYGEETTHVEQQALLPSVRDPKLWLVKCEIGHEREAAVCLMQKSIDRTELQISSAIALDNLKNYIYIEAQKEAHVMEACKGLRYLNPKKIMIVPLKEMAGVLSVKSKPVDISKDTWIRMKIGTYKGDLAKVTDVDDMQQRVTVKLVPRIDLQELADKLAGVEFVKKAFVPPPRLINIIEVREKNIHVERKRDPFTGEYFEKIAGMMFKDGFLYKSVSMKSISYHNIQPSFDELERFLRPGENGDGNFSNSLLSGDTKTEHFSKGDKVLVVSGDLKNMRGIVEKVEDEYACIRPDIKDLPETLTFNVKDLSKFFETGDHVKVVSGTQEGATGMVTKVEGRVLVIVSDASMEEIRVFAHCVMKSSEVTSTNNGNKDYQLHDLVLLNDSSFGIIIRVDGKAYQVLKGTPERAEIEVLMYRDINSKIEKMGTTEDRFRNRISVKDIARIVEGPFKGKQGPVEHIYKQTVFIHDRKNIDHGGFFCVKAKSCTLLGGLYARGDIRGGVMDSRVSSLRSLACIPRSPGRPQIRRDERRYQSGRRGHDSIVGTMVKICKGHYKGSRGRVVDIKGQSVRIELESQMRIVTVGRSEISDKVNVTTPGCDAPLYGLGSETPMRVHDSMREPGTPFHDGMRTPMRNWAWHPYASISPARDSFSLASQLERAASPASGWASRNCSAPGTPRESRTHANSANIMRSPPLLVASGMILIAAT
ncbi:Global transcription factor group A2, putative [Theobroma cacao]|uniref:Transcription elongation factor SPT5 n=1 Tax=Theobroma cacao TaxID=3641 RepID=A0A061DJH1_THECC|nr:Global transcription factor group A2, putative [Theobroma cacao]